MSFQEGSLTSIFRKNKRRGWSTRSLADWNACLQLGRYSGAKKFWHSSGLCSWRITILKVFCLFLIQESTWNLTQEILFDSCVKGACKSMLALVFLMGRFPNDAQWFQCISPWFLQTAHVELSTQAALPEKSAATPRDQYGAMGRVKELWFQLDGAMESIFYFSFFSEVRVKKKIRKKEVKKRLKKKRSVPLPTKQRYPAQHWLVCESLLLGHFQYFILWFHFYVAGLLRWALWKAIISSSNFCRVYTRSSWKQPYNFPGWQCSTALSFRQPNKPGVKSSTERGRRGETQNASENSKESILT